MRLTKPRIPPLPEAEWTDEVREVLPPGSRLNLFTTLIRHPKLFKRWMVFGAHVLPKSTLPVRERELLILRTGYRCNAAYEFHQHTRVGKAAGLTDADIERVKAGPQDAGWSPNERALLQAVDELHEDRFVSDATWAALTPHYGEQQLMDLVFAVGQYTLVSMALNTFGVQIETEAAKS